ncbi:MAG: hypothetical protein U0T75_01990 [Chitinophagales bacterium]
MKILLSIFLAVTYSFTAPAWGSAGHMQGGVIAYYYLKEHNPATIAKVVKALEQHPWYNTEWKEKLEGLAGEDRDVTLFMLASTFPIRRKNCSQAFAMLLVPY